ncbi:TetR/AcrR family transcriptional regulator [Enterobacter sp. CC120223-11]|uniref:TetR/AcrR family transcriptional regulator n=1 Tax=Enterobacter sp. CC120223-11 TaxID=1378073 RepID=UPI000BD0AF1B|nr:TetR/AcrR family transcriptional regulator [Enterobacter sp. CC120223-11]SNY66614.1 transcriptional regulator, TetR family [Enterobacter sp. CC120223-11]
MNTSVRRGRPRDFDRDAVLEKAMETFWQRGYEAASLTDLKAAMGINSPSLYAAFGNKEKLFAEAVAFYLNKYGTYRERALTAAPTAREGITALFEQTLNQFFNSPSHNGCLVVLAALSGSQDSLPVQEILNQERRRTAMLFAHRLQRGQQEGDIAQIANVQILAEYFTTVLFGLTIQVRDGVTHDTLQQVVSLAMQPLNGIAVI